MSDRTRWIILIVLITILTLLVGVRFISTGMSML
ncbi:hypothetical protein CCICO_10470 [Corynebacterium ciconiae DSM 44920]|nr:hypothetical protein CCICO_10470 [Corynebacterium ciconiae DSM 44920]